MKLIAFPRKKRGDGTASSQGSGAPYERLIQRTVAAEDALLLIERTQEKGYRLETCQFDAEKFDPRDICAVCPGLHFCARRNARQEAAIKAMTYARVDALYVLLYDAGVALDSREKDTQKLCARLYADIGMHTEGAEQKEAAENAAEIYQKLLTMTGDRKHYACIRACARIFAGDRWEAREILRKSGVFGEYRSESGR